jgi:hypothetical protein
VAVTVRLPLGDEFLRKSLLIVVLQFSINLKRFNSQMKGVKMAFFKTGAPPVTRD